MSQNLIDSASLLGCRVVEIVVGWHVSGTDRSPVQLFLDFVGRGHVEMYTAGDGSIQCIQALMPNDVDMDEYGRFEYRQAAADHPAAALIGQPILAVERLLWRGSEIGLRLTVATGGVVIANEGDEVFVSDGGLPPDYVEATIG